MMSLRPAIGAVLAAVAVTASPAMAADVPVKRLSGPTPVAECPDALAELAVDDMEFEPHMVVDPRDPEHLVAAWSQDIFFGGRVSTVAVSKDGGRRWRRIVPEGINACSGRPEGHLAGDPWLSFGADGAVYLAQLVGFGDPPPDGRLDLSAIRTRLVVSRSDDGGLTWRRPATFGRADGFNDKEVIAAAPDDPKLLYAGWRFDPATRTEADPLALVVSRSEDRGRTWSEPTSFRTFPTPGSSGQNVQLVPLPGRRLVATWFERSPEGVVTYFAARSRDAGETFGAPVQIWQGDSVRLADPERPQFLMPTAIAFQSMARAGAAIWMTWSDISVRGHDRGRVHLAVSRDGGRTWRTRVAVERPGPVIFPTIAARRDGTLGLTWYDYRDDAPGDEPWTTGSWFASSTDGGRTWRGDVRLGDAFDTRSVPGRVDYPGYFLGDYFGLVALPGAFASAFMTGEPVAGIGPTDILFARIPVPEEPRGRH